MKTQIRFVAVLGCALAAFNTCGLARAAVSQSDAETLTPSLAPMLKQVVPAVVSIGVRGNIPVAQNPLFNDPLFRRFFGSPEQGQPMTRQFQAAGSGVIIDADKGYVLTNDHVVKNADSITVGLTDGRRIDGKVIGADQPSDLAVVQIDAKNLNALPLADSDKLQVGDYVVAVGNPFGLSQTVTMGIVSALGRSGLGIESYEDFIQTDASINPGNSGGALVDVKGELVGINSAILGSTGNIGIGFAIPSNMAQNVTQQLISSGKVSRGRLGVSVETVTPTLAETADVKVEHGALVADVSSGSPADKAGLKTGDVITALNGQNIQTSTELHNQIGLLKPGTQVQITYNRQGKSETVNPVLAQAAPQDENTTTQ